MKYLKSATFGCFDLGIWKSEFVAKTQFLCGKNSISLKWKILKAYIFCRNFSIHFSYKRDYKIFIIFLDRKFLIFKFVKKKIFCNLTSILLKLKVRIFGIVKFVRYALNIIKFYFTKNDLEMFWKFNITIQMLGFFYSYSVFINGVQNLFLIKNIGSKQNDIRFFKKILETR